MRTLSIKISNFPIQLVHKKGREVEFNNFLCEWMAATIMIQNIIIKHPTPNLTPLPLLVKAESR